MKHEVELNIIYNNNNTDKDDNYTFSFNKAIEDIFKEKGILLEVDRITEAENPMKELLLILNDEVITPSQIRMNFFKQGR